MIGDCDVRNDCVMLQHIEITVFLLSETELNYICTATQLFVRDTISAPRGFLCQYALAPPGSKHSTYVDRLLLKRHLDPALFFHSHHSPHKSFSEKLHHRLNFFPTPNHIMPFRFLAKDTNNTFFIFSC